MSCSACGTQVAEELAGDTGVSPSVAMTPPRHCHNCGCFLTKAGFCNDPDCVREVAFDVALSLAGARYLQYDRHASEIETTPTEVIARCLRENSEDSAFHTTMAIRTELERAGFLAQYDPDAAKDWSRPKLHHAVERQLIERIRPQDMVFGQMVWHGESPDYAPDDLAWDQGLDLYPSGHPEDKEWEACPDGGQHLLIPAYGARRVFEGGHWPVVGPAQDFQEPQTSPLSGGESEPENIEMTDVFDGHETETIIAGLRLLQKQSGGLGLALTDDEIDELCERVNFGCVVEAPKVLSQPPPAQMQRSPKDKVTESIVADIDTFEERCKDGERTDTEEAWDLLHNIRDKLSAQITDADSKEYDTTCSE